MNKPVIRPQYVYGHTLIELITTISIAIILLALGIPSWQNLSSSNQMSTAINTITTHLSLARNEAVTRGIDVVICPSTDGDGCSNTIRWDNGFIMYVDKNKNRSLDPDEEILRHINMSSDSIRISSTVGRKKTVYNRFGYVSGYNLTLTFCDSNNRVDPKAVIVSNSGRARLSSLNSKGIALDCSYN